MDVANIYDNGPMTLIARIKDTLSILSAKKWGHYQISYAEPWPRSSPLVIEMVAASGATTIPANGQITKQLVPLLQVADGEMLQIRFEPKDDVEGVIWELSGTGRFNSHNRHARVSMTSDIRDPYLAGSTVFIMGFQRDLNLEVQNPNPVALNQARFQFMGYRYVLEEITPDLSGITKAGGAPDTVKQAEIKVLLANGDKAAVAQFIGPTTWVPAEGR